MAINSDIKKQFSNPFLWFAIATFIIGAVTSYNTIGTNTTYIETVEKRLEKKISLLNSLEKRLTTIEMELLTRKSHINRLGKLENNTELIKIDIAKIKKDLQYINN